MDTAWQYLAEAHILSQPWPVPHIRVHWAMFGLGWRTRDVREILGQAFRLAVAGPGSLTGRYPAGNSGRSDVSAFAEAPVSDELADVLAAAIASECDGDR